MSKKLHVTIEPVPPNYKPTPSYASSWEQCEECGKWLLLEYDAWNGDWDMTEGDCTCNAYYGEDGEMENIWETWQHELDVLVSEPETVLGPGYDKDALWELKIRRHTPDEGFPWCWVVNLDYSTGSIHKPGEGLAHGSNVRLEHALLECLHDWQREKAERAATIDLPESRA